MVLFQEQISTNSVSRDIASKQIVSKSELDEILSVKTTNFLTNGSYIETLRKHFWGVIADIDINVIEADRKLPKDVAYKIEPRVHGGKYRIDILYNSKYQSDMYAFHEIVEVLENLTKTKYETRFHFFELYYNARNNHAISIHTLAKLRYEGFKFRQVNSEAGNHLVQENNRDEIYWKKKLEKYSDMVKVQKAEGRVLKEKRLKTIVDLHDNKIQLRLQALASKNDRIGVANLLDRLLPWEIMTPFEKKFYKNHLNYIRNPLPLEKRVFVFRGSDNSTLFPIEEFEHDHKMAIRKSEVFLTSHFLDYKDVKTKSFENLHKTSFMVDPYNQFKNEFQRATPITSYFYQHSESSFTSPFISFTPNIEIAANFGRNKIVMLAVDPRSIYYNYTTKHKNEVEYLMPFITFPDEVASVLEYNYYIYSKLFSKIHSHVLYEILLDSFEQKLLTKHKNNIYKPDEIIDKIILNTSKEFSVVKKSGLKPFMNPQFDKVINEVIANIPVINSPLTPVTGTSNLNCSDLIRGLIKR